MFEVNTNIIIDNEKRGSNDTLIYECHNGWIRVLWPEYFHVHDFKICEYISKHINIDTSSIHIYDSLFWEHQFVVDGEKIHQFCSNPTFFDDFSSIDNYSLSNPKQLANHLNIDVKSIEKYLVTDFTNENKPIKRGFLQKFLKNNSNKAYKGDKFEIDNYWVFTDFWAKLGISYPTPVSNFVQILNLDRKFMEKLPTTY